MNDAISGVTFATNNLLRALRREDADILLPLTEPWQGEMGRSIFEPGETVRYAYFPCDSSMISLLIVLGDGRSIETALIGREGAVGGIVSHGRLPAYTRAEVQFPGQFLRIELTKLEQAKTHSLTLRHLFARYADCLMAQIFQAVACNAAHSIEQRAAKWLIAAIERTGTTELSLTQEHLAAMLGVGRSYISRVIMSLKERGLLDTRRGRLVVMNFDELQSVACACNACVKRHFDDVLRGVYPSDENVGKQ
jgi:CRP-like cAMP-binding protein